jgi:hypothetical protein
MSKYVGVRFAEFVVLYFTEDKRPPKEKENHAGVALGACGDKGFALFSIYNNGKEDWVERFVNYETFDEAYAAYNEITKEQEINESD